MSTLLTILVAASTGSLTTPKVPVDDSIAEYTIQIPFSRVTDPFKRIAHNQFLSALQNEHARTREDKTIKVFKLELPLFSGTDGTYQYEVSPLETEVVADTMKNAGTYSERDFETHQLKTRKSSRIFGRDLSFRYMASPSGSGAFGLCMNLPGETLGADQTKLPSTMIQLSPPFEPQPFVTATNMVKAKFDFARTCVAVPIGQALDRTLDMKAAMSGASSTGPELETRAPLDQLKDFYATEYVKPEKLEGDELEAAKKDFLSGDWLLKKRSAFLSGVANHLRGKLGDIFHRIAAPETPRQLATALTDVCLRLKFAGSPSYEKLENFCRSDFEQLKIKTFAVPEKYSRAAHCYEGFARLNEYQPNLATCQVEVHLQVALKNPDDRASLNALLIELLSQSVIPDSWRKPIETNGVNAYELAQLIHDWDDQGHTHIDDINWREDFPKMLAEIRQRELN